MLEKVKAALGAAGVSAVGADLLASQVLVGLSSAETYGLTAGIALVAGVLGARLTNIPSKEAALGAKAQKESVIDSNA